MRRAIWMSAAAVALIAGAAGLTAAPAPSPRPPVAAMPPASISYFKQVLPIFQARCQGCHQPAKTGGGYLMTSFDRLVAGGASGKAGVVAGKPEQSHLVSVITPAKGKARMPLNLTPLPTQEIGLIRAWIAQGAVDDTARFTRVKYDAEHPPLYRRAPVITSLDYSPDGTLLAVAGVSEVLLWDAAGGKLQARLIGDAERIESVTFSPDGARLAVVGGQPARTGKIQIWDVAARKLIKSITIGGDTLYGGSWSPNGKLLAFGCPDNTVRAIEVETGQQVLQQGSHTDWVLDTVFNADGTHLISTGRDRTAKLTEVATQRFVDNITSITPGALKGGIAAVARHPKRDEILVGGADGAPGLFQVFRKSNRVIGDNANLIREFPAIPGRINSIEVSRDARRFAAAGGLDQQGQLAVYSYEFDTSVPDDIVAIESKVAGTRNPQEVARLNSFRQSGIKLISRANVKGSNLYALAFQPNGARIATAGDDGQVRLVDTESGTIVHSFVPVPLEGKGAASVLRLPTARPVEAAGKESLPAAARVESLTVSPPSIRLSGPFAYAQLVVRGRLAGGEVVDITRIAERRMVSDHATISPTGLVLPRRDGLTQLKLSLQGRTLIVPVQVIGAAQAPEIDYIRDVQPVLSKLGCSLGTCHGSAQGKNGFKLSLRSYDPIYDVRALTDEHSWRRVNVASPEDSLFLLKSIAAVPHAGGKVTDVSQASYGILRQWVSSGAKLNLTSARVTSIRVEPENPVIQNIGSRQQLRVVARYADGSARDVTREAFLESGNTEVATSNSSGLLTSLRRGEAPILARYEGAYAATTLTVMGDRRGFQWSEPPSYGEIDSLVAGKWKRMKIQPSGLCTDAEFIRRVTIDLTGLPPTSSQVREFLADTRDSRTKRSALVDRLVGSPDYVEYWTNKWADLLQVNRKFLAAEGATAFRNWIKERVAKNVPYDDFAAEIITAQGSNRENPAASYFKILRDPASVMENTTHLFLGVRFNCNKCHDHPFERWTQDNYYNLAAYFAQVGLKPDPQSGGRQIGGTAVEGGKPMYEIVYDQPSGDITHARTGEVAPPKFPFPSRHDGKPASRREELSAWVTSSDNPYFARSYVNRLWGYLFGVGLIEPLDDIRAGNPPSNPELLDYLTRRFVETGYDVQKLVKEITNSRSYQLSLATNRWNADDTTNFSHARPKRLLAEVLFDSIHRVTGSEARLPGLPPGSRAAELADAGLELESGFFGTFGRPARESACECERSSGLQLGPVLALINGPTIGKAIQDPDNAITKLVASEPDDRKVIEEIFLRVLNRPATEAEVKAGLASLAEIQADHERLATAVKSRETELVPITARLERERLTAIEETSKELSTYEKEIAPRVAQQEKEKADRTAQLQADLDQYLAGLGARVTAWESQQKRLKLWTPLAPLAATSTTKAQFKTLPDNSVLVSGEQARGVVTMRTAPGATQLTGLRLEAIPDPSLPQGGPGRAGDGNFVLTEIEVFVTGANGAGPRRKLTLQRAVADFNQQGFNIANTIDGQPGNQNKGWAVSPTAGVVHWATYEFKEPVDIAAGQELSIVLHHQFNRPEFGLGRFRLSSTAAPAGFGLTLPELLEAIVARPAVDRTQADWNLLLAYHRAVDPGAQQRRQAVAVSRQPLPIDPKLKELREQLELAKRPVPPDGRLEQLRKDLEQSRLQNENRRLTAAQDLAWALINSPAFLFNY